MMRGRVICLWLALNLAVGGWRNAKVALKRRDKIRLIPVLAVATAFESCGVDLRLRYMVVGVRILRMLDQPFFHRRRHRWRLLLLLWLLSLLIHGLAVDLFGPFHLLQPLSQSGLASLFSRGCGCGLNRFWRLCVDSGLGQFCRRLLRRGCNRRLVLGGELRLIFAAH